MRLLLCLILVLLPMNKIVKLISYNTTGLDTIKLKWINELLETFDIELVQLQEHFKAIRQVDSYYKQNFKKYDSYAIPAIRGNVNHVGRPKGGLVQMVNKQSIIKKERIPNKSWRVQAQVLHVKNYKLLWINVYMPTDPQTQQLDEAEILETLSEIDKIIETATFHDIVLGGDFNWDQRRSTGFSRIMDDFMSKYGLVSI